MKWVSCPFIQQFLNARNPFMCMSAMLHLRGTVGLIPGNALVSLSKKFYSQCSSPFTCKTLYSLLRATIPAPGAVAVTQSTWVEHRHPNAWPLVAAEAFALCVCVCVYSMHAWSACKVCAYCGHCTYVLYGNTYAGTWREFNKRKSGTGTTPQETC